MSPKQSPSRAMKHIVGSGDFDQEVVGESHYQKALVRIAGRHTRDGRRVECPGVLYLEPDNPHDANAISVEIRGERVGYIPRGDAPDLRSELARLGIRNGERVGVDAVIIGGGTGQSYGVWLDIPYDDDDDDDDEPEVALTASKATQQSIDETVMRRPVGGPPPGPAIAPAQRKGPGVLLGLLATAVTVAVVGALVTWLLTLF